MSSQCSCLENVNTTPYLLPSTFRELFSLLLTLSCTEEVRISIPCRQRLGKKGSVLPYAQFPTTGAGEVCVPGPSHRDRGGVFLVPATGTGEVCVPGPSHWDRGGVFLVPATGTGEVCSWSQPLGQGRCVFLVPATGTGEVCSWSQPLGQGRCVFLVPATALTTGLLQPPAVSNIGCQTSEITPLIG